MESSNVPGGSALCLDVQWGSAANGTPVWLWPCTGSVAQQWSYNSSTRQLTAMGKCLEFAAPVVQGSQLQIWDCNGSFQQRWSVVPYEDGTWGFSPVAFANFVGFRMDLVKNVAVAQQPLWAWPTNSSSAQKFRFYTR
ncbi:putative secreted hydrolase [Labilithrix luteola]|uniref:Putative secreted hydrolase n=1 Tax=Labilithrix luteola TaxID=1391654 RepID=A0A0K1Q075_9BACT|nr:putative secreted hydrolase [Labilithrix luteola]